MQVSVEQAAKVAMKAAAREHLTIDDSSCIVAGQKTRRVAYPAGFLVSGTWRSFLGRVGADSAPVRDGGEKVMSCSTARTRRQSRMV